MENKKSKIVNINLN